MESNGFKSQGKILYYLLLIILGVCVCFLLGESGPVIEKDSDGFLDANEGVKSAYPLYVFFLGACRMLFEEKFFLQGVHLLQSGLAISTSILLTRYIRQQYGCNVILSIVVYLFTFLPYMYSLPESVVTHHILTEALAIPLMTMFFFFSIKFYVERKWRDFFALGGITILLSLTRSQLRLLLVVYVGMFLFLILQIAYKKVAIKHKKWFGSLLCMICMLLIFLCMSMMKWMVRENLWPQLTDAVAGRTLCAIKYQDRGLFEGEEQELFDYIYNVVDEGQFRKEYFRNDSWRGNDIAYASNENVKIYYEEIGKCSYWLYPGISAGEMQDIIARLRIKFIAPLFLEHIWEYMLMTIELLPQSFVASIFIQPDSIRGICYFISAALYIGAMVLVIYCYQKKIHKKYYIPMLITLYIISMNNLLTNLLFYGQQRYVIYMFGAFYISVVVLVQGIYRNRLDTKVGRKGVF